MKILVITNIAPPVVIGGYETLALDKAAALKKRGHKIIVATSAYDIRQARPNYDMTPYKNLDIRRIFMPFIKWESAYDLYWRGSKYYQHEQAHRAGGYIEANCYALRHLIQTENPDVIYCFNPIGLGPLGILETALAYKGKKVVLHLMDRIDSMIKDGALMLGLQPKWGMIKAKVNAISCSQMIADQNQTKKNTSTGIIARWLHLNKKTSYAQKNLSTQPEIPQIDNRFATMHVVHNAADKKRWGAHKLKKISTPISHLKIAFWGRLVREKGLQDMIEVADLLKSEKKLSFQIDIYGSGDQTYISQVKDEVKRRGLESEINLKGFTDPKNLKKILTNYHVGLFLLWKDEPFAISPVESILAGLYTLYYNDTTMTEVMGVSPLGLKREDFISIATTLSLIAKGDLRLKKERERMYKVCSVELSLKNTVVKKIEAALRSALPSAGFDVEIPMAYARQSRYPIENNYSASMAYQKRYTGGKKLQIRYAK